MQLAPRHEPPTRRWSPCLPACEVSRPMALECDFGPQRGGVGSGARLTIARHMATDVAAPLSLRALEDHLWTSADLFRGLTDVEVQRDYVLALLFFKRASDIHREETAAAIEELGHAPDPAAIIATNVDAYH